MFNLEYSSQAQEVLPQFYNADIIVFTEGQEGGDDSIFWTNIFEQFCSKKVQISPRGGKSELLKILNQKGGLPHNIYMVLDRDLESVNSSIGSRKHLIYTFGYSYENDLYSNSLIESIISSYLHLPRAQQMKIQKEIANLIDNFRQEIAPYMCAFAKATLKHISLLPVPGNNSNFEPFFKEKSLDINHAVVNKCLKKLKGKCCKSRKHEPFDEIRFCNGHLFETFVHRLVNRFSNKKKKLSKDTLRALALRGFEKFLDREVRQYYAKHLSKI